MIWVTHYKPLRPEESETVTSKCKKKALPAQKCMSSLKKKCPSEMLK